MSSSDKTMEEQLKAAGNRLLQPPDSLDELLPLLDQTEDLLSKVEQSPVKSIQTALSPLMKALVADELLKHSDVDVKVAVASCISEITRITAPDAPYDDEKMKDIFQLVVSSFEHLSDQSSRSYAKRTMILETVSKVRSCVIMLDLECDQLITEMFQHFLKAIRDYHPENILTSMETIMTVVLDESEAISPELLAILLASVKRNNEEFLPVSTKLGERVFERCAVKLKPYLIRSLKSLGISLDDYSEVVTSVCKWTGGPTGHNSDSTCIDQSVAIDVAGGTSLDEENPDVKVLAKSILSNGVNETGNGVILTDVDFKKAGSFDAKLTSETESDDLAAQKQTSSESNPEQAAEQRGKRPSSSNNSTEISGIGDNERGVEQLSVHLGSRGKDVATVEDEKPLDKVKETRIQLSPSKASERKDVNVAFPSPTGILLDESRPKKAGRPKKKENLVKNKRVSVDAASKKASDGASDSETKKHRRFGKREPAEIPENQVLAEEDTREDGGTPSQSEANLPNQTDDKVDAANNEMKAGSSSKNEDDKKHEHVKARVDKDKLKSSAKDDAKDMVASLRSPKKSTNVESSREETPRMSTKRKGTPGADKASGTREFGENLVGSKVKVWWPKDRMFYEGIIDSFDSVKKKHKILYNDGDEEKLNLRKERWEFVDNSSVVDAGQPVDFASTDTPSEMQTKKAKTNPEASSKDGKMKLSHKSKGKNTGTSGHKSTNAAKPDPKVDNETSSSGGKSEDDTSGKSKNQSQKVSGKSVDDSQKASGKSKDVDTAKISGNSKQGRQKTPNSNGKGNTKLSLPKSKETDRMKEKATGSGKMSEIKKGKSEDKSKARESDTNSGKKRQRC